MVGVSAFNVFEFLAASPLYCLPVRSWCRPDLFLIRSAVYPVARLLQPCRTYKSDRHEFTKAGWNPFPHSPTPYLPGARVRKSMLQPIPRAVTDAIAAADTADTAAVAGLVSTTGGVQPVRPLLTTPPRAAKRPRLPSKGVPAGKFRAAALRSRTGRHHRSSSSCRTGARAASMRMAAASE